MMLVWGQSHHGGGSWIGDLLVAGGVLISAINALIARRTAQAGADPLVDLELAADISVRCRERCSCSSCP